VIREARFLALDSQLSAFLRSLPCPHLSSTNPLHTPLCKHAFVNRGVCRRGTAAEFARIIFTCHCPLPDGISAGVRMAPEQFDYYAELIARNALRLRDASTSGSDSKAIFYPASNRGSKNSTRVFRCITCSAPYIRRCRLSGALFQRR